MGTYKLGDKIPRYIVEAFVVKYAKQYGADAYGMLRTIECESHFYNVQSNVITRTGAKEFSFGIAQIHLGFHPTVTKEQALSPEFSVEFMAKNWGKVKWYGWIKSMDACNGAY